MKGYFDENYQLLANAIIECAAKDYVANKKKAIRKNDMFIDARLNECERFFMSDYFIQLCPEDIDGSWFLKKLDEKVEEELKNTKPKKDVNSIERMRKEGMTYKEIGKVYGVADQTVRNFLQRYKEPNKRAGDMSKSVLKDMYLNKKMSMKDVAKHFECSITTVDYYLRKYNIPKRKLSELKRKPNKEEIIQMLAEGLNVVQIAEKYGLCNNTIYDEMKKHGIKSPKKRKK